MFSNLENHLNSDNQKEFINRRSFEIAWAVFRCAFLVSQPRLKEELENRAVEITAFPGEKSRLGSLENLILLAEAVGEIRTLDAKILFRELAGLKKAIDKEEKIIRQEKEDNSAIGDIFAALPPAPTGRQAVQSADFINESVKIFSNNTEKTSKLKEFGKILDNPAKPVNNSAKAVDNSANLPNSARNQEVRQNLILKKVAETGSATTKDLLADFPYLSERTIRAYLQRLCEAGLLERVGTSGPGSYYRALPRAK